MRVRKKIINIHLKSFKDTTMYIIGSSVYSQDYVDIDIAVIYDKSLVKMDEIIEYRRIIKTEVLKKLNCSCDVLLLSKEEEVEMKFLYNAKNEKIF